MMSSREGAGGAEHGGSRVVVQTLTALFIIASFGYLIAGVLHYIRR
jgi:hypothetical protein